MNVMQWTEICYRNVSTWFAGRFEFWLYVSLLIMANYTYRLTERQCRHDWFIFVDSLVEASCNVLRVSLMPN